MCSVQFVHNSCHFLAQPPPPVCQLVLDDTHGNRPEWPITVLRD